MTGVTKPIRQAQNMLKLATSGLAGRCGQAASVELDAGCGFGEARLCRESAVAVPRHCISLQYTMRVVRFSQRSRRTSVRTKHAADLADQHA